MGKYETWFKHKVVESFLAGEGDAKLLARRWSVPEEKIRTWVRHYRLHGIAAPQPKRGAYTAEFKLQVLMHQDPERLSCRRVDAIYDVRNPNQIVAWRRAFDSGGVAALESRRPARPMKVDMLELGPDYPLPLLLTGAGLSRSTFYDQAKVLETRDKYADLKSSIKAIYECHKGRYGYRRITTELRQACQAVNHKAVQRLMNDLGLKSLVRPKRHHSYRGESTSSSNVLDRQFDAARPNEKWVTDVIDSISEAQSSTCHRSWTSTTAKLWPSRCRSALCTPLQETCSRRRSRG